jgi:hypothetical protein
MALRYRLPSEGMKSGRCTWCQNRSVTGIVAQCIDERLTDMGIPLVEPHSRKYGPHTAFIYCCTPACLQEMEGVFALKDARLPPVPPSSSATPSTPAKKPVPRPKSPYCPQCEAEGSLNHQCQTCGALFCTASCFRKHDSGRKCQH